MRQPVLVGDLGAILGQLLRLGEVGLRAREVDIILLYLGATPADRRPPGVLAAVREAAQTGSDEMINEWELQKQRWRDEGRGEGEARGEARGEAKGRVEGVLEARFGTVPQEVQATLDRCPIEILQELAVEAAICESMAAFAAAAARLAPAR